MLKAIKRSRKEHWGLAAASTYMAVVLVIASWPAPALDVRPAYERTVKLQQFQHDTPPSSERGR